MIQLVACPREGCRNTIEVEVWIEVVDEAHTVEWSMCPPTCAVGHPLTADEQWAAENAAEYQALHRLD